MRLKFLILLFSLHIGFLHGYEEKLTLSVDTMPAGGKYAPKNVVAVWVEKTDGTFIKTIERWAGKAASSLAKWREKAGPNDVDAVSGATRLNHTSTIHFTYDLKDRNSEVIQDGFYLIWMELNDGEDSALAYFVFKKDGKYTPQVTYNAPSFKNVNITYTGRRHLLTLTANNSSGGTTTHSTPAEYEEGSEITFSATANNGWQFSHWSGDTAQLIDTTLAEQTIQIFEPTTLEANFVRKNYALKISAQSGGKIVRPVKEFSAQPFETIVNIEAASIHEDFQFEGWQYTGSAPNSLMNLSSSVKIETDTQIVALFSLKEGSDTDLDNISDNWELDHFGHLASTANENPDGDALTNYEEFIKQTDPGKLTYYLEKGWNLISIPEELTNTTFGNYFNDNSLTIWEWDSSYYKLVNSTDLIFPKKGYWIFANETIKFEKSVTLFSDNSIHLKPQWNLIGTGKSAYSELRVWGWQNNSYEAGNTIKPTLGYWYYSTRDEQISLPQTAE